MCNASVVVVGTEGGEQAERRVLGRESRRYIYYSPIMAGIRKSTLMSDIGERSAEYYEACRRIVLITLALTLYIMYIAPIDVISTLRRYLHVVCQFWRFGSFF